ncbi:MAG: hypothetical protein EOO53_21775 [Gammaproteobacteria bacterium]|nr:MAG: hypothetical protein EOO53_21775 [Gammaproteobacteria bacterium]
MSRQQKNRIRALLLLMVFSLNTVAGFACSMGVDMGYNTKHHEHQEIKPHSHSKPHSHDAAHQHKHNHSHKPSGASINNLKNTDDCCANDVTSFIKLDKSVVSNNLLLQQPIFFLAFTASFFSSNVSNIETSIKGKFPYLRRWRPPNDTDIRIAIQSFQI